MPNRKHEWGVQKHIHRVSANRRPTCAPSTGPPRLLVVAGTRGVRAGAGPRPVAVVVVLVLDHAVAVVVVLDDLRRGGVGLRRCPE